MELNQLTQMTACMHGVWFDGCRVTYDGMKWDRLRLPCFSDMTYSWYIIGVFIVDSITIIKSTKLKN